MCFLFALKFNLSLLDRYAAKQNNRAIWHFANHLKILLYDRVLTIDDKCIYPSRWPLGTESYYRNGPESLPCFIHLFFVYSLRTRSLVCLTVWGESKIQKKIMHRFLMDEHKSNKMLLLLFYEYLNTTDTARGDNKWPTAERNAPKRHLFVTAFGIFNRSVFRFRVSNNERESRALMDWGITMQNRWLSVQRDNERASVESLRSCSIVRRLSVRVGGSKFLKSFLVTCSIVLLCTLFRWNKT